jgi:hypothetical protein
LDTDYLGQLSTDSVPVLAAAFTNANLSQTEKNEVGALLACWSYQLANETDQSWQSFTFSKSTAWAALQPLQVQLGSYPVDGENGVNVTVNGQERLCFGFNSID